MNTKIKLGAAILLLSAMAAPTFANTILSTADFTDYGANEPGSYSIDSSDLYAVSFNVDKATQLSSIGGYFSQYSYGTFFGAVVAANSLNALTADNAASSSLAYTTFTPDGTDQKFDLSALLGPGVYDLVFGAIGDVFSSGGGLVSGQTQNQNFANTFQLTNGSWAPSQNQDVRVTVNGATVPEPNSLVLMLSSLLGIGAFTRLRRRNSI
ncbi:MAG: hypothetical protein JWM78_3716 [Verrucomicrobiaceae bacterium]|nr:hypothetical protein [Verrucomicrobiaceae bacterium]